MTSSGEGGGGGGGRLLAETWWASRGGSSDERNAREGGRGGTGVRRAVLREGGRGGRGVGRVRRGGGRGGIGVRREGAGRHKVEKAKAGEKAEASCIAALSTRQQTDRRRTEINILCSNGFLLFRQVSKWYCRSTEGWGLWQSALAPIAMTLMAGS